MRGPVDRNRTFFSSLNISNRTEQHTNDHIEYIPQRRTSNDKVRRVVVTYPTHQHQRYFARNPTTFSRARPLSVSGQSLRVISSKVSSLSAVCCCCCCCDPFKLRLRGISQALFQVTHPGVPTNLPTYLRERTREPKVTTKSVGANLSRHVLGNWPCKRSGPASKNLQIY